MRIETALLSVYDKEGVVELGRALVEMGIKIVSTGGTCLALSEAAIPVVEIGDYTGFPEILDGRVKTLHPMIHGGILARHDDLLHRENLEVHGISPIGLVVVNLYPFVQTIQRAGVKEEEAIEQIDIGGPTMIRAAAKNHRFITVVVDPADYQAVLEEIKDQHGETSLATRRVLARKAFHHTAAYDSAIAGYFDSLHRERAQELPRALDLNLRKVAALRYGENPHQRAALYQPSVGSPRGLVAAQQHQGKELSFNNYLDLDAAWSLCQEFKEPACAIIKHNNPCGTALGRDLAQAYQRALECDPDSAFGSVIALNRVVDLVTAQSLGSLFVEAVIAPGYEAPALSQLKGKKNLRVIELKDEDATGQPAGGGLDFKKICGGFLVQDRDLIQEAEWKVVTQREPSKEQQAELLFAWLVCKHVKSNAIVLARNGQTLGIGAGQMSRVDSVRIAVRKARVDLKNCVLASDGFFPFPDALEEAAQAGVAAVVQPGGSIRDHEVISAADRLGLAMVFTGHRHFKH